MFLNFCPCFVERRIPTFFDVRNFFCFARMSLFCLSMSCCVIFSRVFVLKMWIGFWIWIALFIAWNLPSVIIRISSADLSRAFELQPRMWALCFAPCFIITFLFCFSRCCFIFGIRSMYWIVAARLIVFALSLFSGSRFMFLNFFLASICRIFII